MKKVEYTKKQLQKIANLKKNFPYGTTRFSGGYFDGYLYLRVFTSESINCYTLNRFGKVICVSNSSL